MSLAVEDLFWLVPIFFTYGYSADSCDFGVLSLFFNEYLKNNFIYSFIFGYAGSLLLCGLFSRCGKQGLLSSRGVGASHCGGCSCC